MKNNKPYPPLIEKLRRQFLSWHMIINTMIVLGSLLFINIITNYSLQLHNAQNLKNVKNATLQTNNEISLLSFVIALDKNDNIVASQSPINLPPSIFKEALNLFLNKRQSEGKILLSTGDWLYQADMTEQGTIIYFLDITQSQILARNLLLISTLISILVIILNLIVSINFSNKIIKPIATTFKKQKQFIADASHELKTPLAIMNTNIEAALMENDLQKSQHWLTNTTTQIERMNELIKKLLLLAKYDEQSIITKKNTFDLNELIREVITENKARIEAKKLIIENKAQSNITLYSDQLSIRQVITIVIDNAIKYTPEGQKIKIKIEEKNRKKTLIIKNYGVTLSQEKSARLFDRFYKIDDSRKYDGSYGLGLSIAQEIMTELAGKIEVDSSQENAVMFKITF